MDRVASFGFIAKAAVYAVIGVFALQFSFGNGGGLLGSEEAASKILLQPFGQVLLGLLGAGLACYAVWRIVQAALDPDGAGHDLERVATRIGWAGSAVIHGFLAISAFQTLAGSRGNDQGRSWLATIFGWPGGPWLLIAIGLGVIAFGGWQVVRAYRGSFRKELETYRMSATERTWATRIGRFGLVARGLVFAIVGTFFISAGRHAKTSGDTGTGAALREIASGRWGSILLPVVAAGLVAYALHMLVNARYRRTFA